MLGAALSSSLLQLCRCWTLLLYCTTVPVLILVFSCVVVVKTCLCYFVFYFTVLSCVALSVGSEFVKNATLIVYYYYYYYYYLFIDGWQYFKTNKTSPWTLCSAILLTCTFVPLPVPHSTSFVHYLFTWLASLVLQGAFKTLCKHHFTTNSSIC